MKTDERKVKGYVAFDGKFFLDADECKLYEDNKRVGFNSLCYRIYNSDSVDLTADEKKLFTHFANSLGLLVCECGNDVDEKDIYCQDCVPEC